MKPVRLLPPLIALACLFASTRMQGVVVQGGWTTATLADGTAVEVLPRGDEFSHSFLTADGRRFIMGADGLLVPATDASRRRGAARRAAANNARLSRRQASTVNPYVGSKKGLIILVAFNNQDFCHDQAWDTWWRIANEEGYSEGKAVGSIHDYFYDQSYGQFNIVFDVVGPVTLPYDYSHYGRNDSDGLDANVGELVRDACIAVDTEVDFRDYDWNSDGEANVVYILYAGSGESSYSATKPDLIWPHEWELDEWELPTGPLFLDGTHINVYACGSELSGGNQLSGLGTFCHEFAHALGLPDLYNTDDTDDYVLARWDALSTGCYNNSSWCPAGFSAYERIFCGWMKAEELILDRSVSGMQPLSEAAEAYLIRNEAADPGTDEYYLLENRQLLKWDSYLPGSGLLVTHIDYDEDAWYYNTVNSDARHYRLSHIAAYGRQGSYSVTFPRPLPDELRDRLTDSSTPSATVFNVNKSGKKTMGKPVTNITVSADGLVSFDFTDEIRASAAIHLPPAGEQPTANGQQPTALLPPQIELRRNPQTNIIYKQLKTR